MPTFINVNFSNDDSYRYKMESPSIRHEGFGNGIRTTIDNIAQIAQALKRTEMEIVKHFEFSFGTISKAKGDNGYEFMGKQDYETVIKALKSFVTNYILCQYCQNPETEHEVQANQIISHCRACGKHFSLEPKNTMKLISWLIKRQFPQEQRKRKGLSPSQIVAKCSKAYQLGKKEMLEKQLNELVADYQITQDEIPSIIVAVIFQEPEINKQTLLELAEAMSIISTNLHIQLLYSLECLYKQKEELFEKYPTLFGAILQAIANKLNKNVVSFYRSEDSQPFVPPEYHERCLKAATVFFEWFDESDEQVEEEIEEVEER